MIDRYIMNGHKCFKLFLILLMFGKFSLAIASQDNSNNVETEYFKLQLPSSMELAGKDKIVMMNNQEAYQYVYTEKNKDPKNTILLAITPEHGRTIKKDERRYALHTIASSLRDTVIQPKCKSKISDFIYTDIDSNDAIYFEILSEDCKGKFERYWILLKDDYVFTIYLARRDSSNLKVYQEVERSIKSIKFKSLIKETI